MPSNPNKPHELRNISRIDKHSKKWNSSNHAWQVRFMRNKKPISQWFEDTKHGNKKEYLKAAKLFRDSMEKELGKIPKGKQIKQQVDFERRINEKKKPINLTKDTFLI